MEKTIKWDPSETMLIQNIDQERTQVLAQIGALMMDLENARKNLDTINGRQKSAIQQALNTRGITQFESARPIPGGLLLQMPDKVSENGNSSGGE